MEPRRRGRWRSPPPRPGAAGGRAGDGSGGRAAGGRAPGCGVAAATVVQATPSPTATSCSTARVAAVPRLPSWVAWRQISTSIVDVPASPRTRITPNDVNVKTKTIEAAARMAGRKQRQGDLPERPPRRGAERRRGGLQVAGEVLPHGTHGAHHDSQVEHDVGDEDRRDAALPSGRQEGEDGSAHDDGREHEPRRQQRRQQAPPGEAVAGEHVRRAEPDGDRQHRADDGLPQREPGDVPRHRPGEGGSHRRRA